MVTKSILYDVTVLEVGAYLSAPKSTRILAEFGANVLKIEDPTTGTPFRHAGVNPIEGITYKFLSMDRGKKSIALNLTSKAGREVFKDLAADADVVVENMSPGWMEKNEIGYEDIQAINEDIIYCSISGFGATGPLRNRKSVDFIAQAMSGLTSQNAVTVEGKRGLLSGWLAADEVTSIYSAMAILAALLGDEGTHIDMAMVDALIGSFEDKVAGYSEGQGISPPGDPSGRGGPKGLFETKTEPVAVWLLPPIPERWLTFWDILGLDEWVEAEKFVDNDEITENSEYLQNKVKEQFKTKPQVYWLEKFEEAEIMAAPALTIEEALTHEQVQSRPVLTNEVDERLGEYLQVNFPANYSEYEVKTSLPAATLGEHTRELLERAGYSKAEIDELYDNDIVA